MNLLEQGKIDIWEQFISINFLLMSIMHNSYWRYITMNGIKPNFLKDDKMPQSYYATPDPYSNPVPTKINLLEMSRYARKTGKKLSELTKDEVKKFEI